MIKNIRIEYLDNPIGLGIRQPRITWSLDGVRKQTAFEIVYSVNGVKKANILYYTPSMNYTFTDPFNSRDIVTFKMRVQNEFDMWSEFSEEHSFEFGLLNESDWTAKWITGDYEVEKKNRYPVDIFKRYFSSIHLKKARLYITSCGIYQAYINGKKVGDYILTPGFTDYRKRLNYQTYDVSSLIKDGENDITIEVADGWYRGSVGVKGRSEVYGKQTKVIAQLEIVDSLGNKNLVTDSSWSWTNDGPIRFTDLKDGETIDNRMVPTFERYAKEVKEINLTNINLTCENAEGVIESDVSSPIRVFSSRRGNQIFEFKNNVSGYISFECVGRNGQEIDIVLGEMLDEDNDVTLKNVQYVKKGKATPLQTIHFICKDGINSYKSKFFYAGFKFISIKSSVKFQEENIKQIAINSKLTPTFTFECSNDLINTFVDNTFKSLKSNSIDIPTNSPSKGRIGKTGETQVLFNTASFLCNYAPFIRKYMIDVFDRQELDGRLPQIAPYSKEDWYMNIMNGSIGWSDIGILIPYRYYKKYGDKRLLVENFEAIEKYAKFMIRRCGLAKGTTLLFAKPLHLSNENRRYQVNTGQSYGEYKEPNDVKATTWKDYLKPHPEESMAYTYWMMSLMSEICDIVGNLKNKKMYQKYAEGIKNAYQELVTKEKYSLDIDRQAKLVRPLYLNLLNPDQEDKAKDRLVQALNFYRWRVGTGLLSTPFILDVLSKINPNYAYILLENEQMPGWLYMSKYSTGSIWERWEETALSDGSSLNNCSKGTMVEWLFSGMCGINFERENRFIIAPIIGGKVSYASCSYDSVYGAISVSWKRNANKVIFDIEIPGNTTATFKFKGSENLLLSGKHHFEF